MHSVTARCKEKFSATSAAVEAQEKTLSGSALYAEDNHVTAEDRKLPNE